MRRLQRTYLRDDNNNQVLTNGLHNEDRQRLMQQSLVVHRVRFNNHKPLLVNGYHRNKVLPPLVPRRAGIRNG